MRKTHRAPAIQEDVPSVDHAGNGAGQQGVVHRQPAPVVFFVPIDRCQSRGRPLGVDRKDLFCLGIVDQDLRVASHAVERGIRHGQSGLSGNRSVKAVPARLQDAHCRPCRFELHRRYGVLAAANHRPHLVVGFLLILSRNAHGCEEAN